MCISGFQDVQGRAACRSGVTWGPTCRWTAAGRRQRRQMTLMPASDVHNNWAAGDSLPGCIVRRFCSLLVLHPDQYMVNVLPFALEPLLSNICTIIVAN
jgi:hypothetical protein